MRDNMLPPIELVQLGHNIVAPASVVLDVAFRELGRAQVTIALLREQLAKVDSSAS